MKNVNIWCLVFKGSLGYVQGIRTLKLQLSNQSHILFLFVQWDNHPTEVHSTVIISWTRCNRWQFLLSILGPEEWKKNDSFIIFSSISISGKSKEFNWKVYELPGFSNEIKLKTNLHQTHLAFLQRKWTSLVLIWPDPVTNCDS